jgi:magnesium transporter
VAARSSAARVERELARVLIAEYADEAARLMETASDAESSALLDGVPAETAVAVLLHLTPDRAARVIALLRPERIRTVLGALPPNRAAPLLARLDPGERERCLAALDRSLAEELRALASYPADTAGALMDPRVTTFRRDARVRDVVQRLRTFRNHRISDVFLVGEEGALVAAASLQDVVLATPDTALAEIARPRPPSVRATAAREEVVERFESEGLANLPVVDFEGRVVGVLRQRELLQAAQEEASADAVTMVGASLDERALSKPLFAVRKRLPWLQVNLLTAFLASAVVGLFEETIARVTALAVLLPVVAGQSGNTGAQALAITMRGLALREVRARQWWPVVRKETLAGLGNGVAVAATTAAAVYAWSRSEGLALVIGTSMVLSMTLAGLAGAAIPMLLSAARQDPAQSSSIILTTVTDVVGFFSFLGIATLFASWLEVG